MNLEDTVDLMLGGNFIERFLAEYHQLNIRIAGLERMLKGYREGTLDFTPNCPYEILDAQLVCMKAYREVLEERAKYEAKHKKDNTILFENMVRDVMYYRKITYDQIKSWTVFQIKDAYIVECLREQEEREWLLVSSGNYKIDIKEIKHWKDVTKLK